jgi:hypothetical protein
MRAEAHLGFDLEGRDPSLESVAAGGVGLDVGGSGAARHASRLRIKAEARGLGRAQRPTSQALAHACQKACWPGSFGPERRIVRSVRPFEPGRLSPARECAEDRLCRRFARSFPGRSSRIA